jgi:hypothetical protein
VRALRILTCGTKMAVGHAGADATMGAYNMTLPTGAPASVAYATNAAKFTFASDTPKAGQDRLEARSNSATKSADDSLPSTADFVFS